MVGLRKHSSGVEPPACPDEPQAPAERPLARSMVSPEVPCISSEILLAGATEVHIQHRGSLYRLKQTALGKLILTK